MLEPDADKRPSVWQVAEVAFRIRGLKNPIGNVFRSQPPPSILPTAPRSQTKPASQSQTKALPPKETVTSTVQTPTTTDSKARLVFILLASSSSGILKVYKLYICRVQ